MSTTSTNGASVSRHGAGELLPTAAPREVLPVERLPLAGHSAWKAHLPPEIRFECEAAFGALVPRAAVELYVPDQDYAGRRIETATILEDLQREVSAVIGGQTSFQACGEYFPLAGRKLAEQTVVLTTFLPTVVNDELRVWLIGLLLRFGVSAQQDVVQVQIASSGYWLHTGLLRERPDIVRQLPSMTAARPGL